LVGSSAREHFTNHRQKIRRNRNRAWLTDFGDHLTKPVGVEHFESLGENFGEKRTNGHE
jgi:hypothetical protein